MAKTATQIQKESDERRGLRSKGYKLPIETIDKIAELSKRAGMPQAQVIGEAIKLFEQTINKSAS